MKHKMLVLILALTAMSWAQTATPAVPSTPQQSTAPDEKEKSSCCDKMAGDAKDGQKCSAHAMKHTDGSGMASCCSGKEAKSCCNGSASGSCKKSDKNQSGCCGSSCSKDKSAAMCCGNNAKGCGKGCCSKNGEKAAVNCACAGLHG